MNKTFLDVNVGDTVICYDEYAHDYIEHKLKVTSIEEDKEYSTESNPKGRVLYGEDLTYGDDDEMMICTVYESNFLEVYSLKIEAIAKYFNSEKNSNDKNENNVTTKIE